MLGLGGAPGDRVPHVMKSKVEEPSVLGWGRREKLPLNSVLWGASLRILGDTVSCPQGTPSESREGSVSL